MRLSENSPESLERLVAGEVRVLGNLRGLVSGGQLPENRPSNFSAVVLRER